MSGDDFNGIGHIHSRTEDGRGYGLNPVLYQRMAHAVMSASRETGIEPASIWPVADGPGSELLLESNERFGLLLQVRPERIDLYFASMDSPERFLVLVSDVEDSSWAHVQIVLTRLGDWVAQLQSWQEARLALSQPLVLDDLVCCL
jgi:hypothetical protein